MRIALGVEYQGCKFHGWQVQPNVITLQTTIQRALSKIANEPITVFCAGRTDAGVHATNQVLHFDTQVQRPQKAWILGTNTHLANTVTVKWAKTLDNTFHARFSALSRRYQYVIYNHSIPSCHLASLTTWVPQHLDENAMNQAAQSLIGEHDFSSFRSASCQSKTPKRHLFGIQIKRNNHLVLIDIVANSFLHHMVRNIVGVLIEIGSQRREISWCEELLNQKNRKMAAKTAPPQGLYLSGVRYADHYNIPCDFNLPLFI